MCDAFGVIYIGYNAINKFASTITVYKFRVPSGFVFVVFEVMFVVIFERTFSLEWYVGR